MTKKTKSNRAQPPPKEKKLFSDLSETGQRLNQTSKDFLKVDVQTALTFTGAALSTNDPEKKRRNTNNAKKAYHTIERFSERVTYTDAEQAYMTEMMDRLRKDLAQLGETV